MSHYISIWILVLEERFGDLFADPFDFFEMNTILKNFNLIKLAKSSSKCSNSKIKYVFENESNMEFHVDFRISFGPFSNFVTAAAQ